ncbi:hypothetical protein [Nocardioides nitrophenolicus]|uniref:hypothetical protein n=1 Tax=Nocardioides nitrophenolicus TaxID=60489 RepID=UPI00195BD7CC|nr:hypothetical protein [Nocardioides nitrophenolicus]MBM7515814.1 hypothetical protein [Nocardioides nitrophenolicus]
MSSRSDDDGELRADPDQHAATLRATRDAHRDAQAILALAGQVRDEASGAAEAIVLEAREAAERTRLEVAEWAAEQRTKVDALVHDLAEAATLDADVIRAEALRTSMTEAEETARHYVAEATVRAEQAARRIRSEAHLVLEHATELCDEVTEAIADLTWAAAAVSSRIEGARARMADVLAQHAPPEAGPDEVEEADGLGG